MSNTGKTSYKLFSSFVRQNLENGKKCPKLLGNGMLTLSIDTKFDDLG